MNRGEAESPQGGGAIERGREAGEEPEQPGAVAFRPLCPWCPERPGGQNPTAGLVTKSHPALASVVPLEGLRRGGGPGHGQRWGGAGPCVPPVSPARCSVTCEVFAGTPAHGSLTPCLPSVPSLMAEGTHSSL